MNIQENSTNGRFHIEISDRLRQAAPDYQALVIESDVANEPTPDVLWQRIVTVASRVRESYAMEMVNKRPAIAATRAGYKACGKEPNRYRPSAEALMRRMVKGMELYRTDTVIDLINLLSVATGHSIGGFDADKVAGDKITLGVGEEGEPYEAIGRGPLNIAGMPVWRDAVGGFGTPSSDNERTKLSPDTRHLLMIINMYGLENTPADVCDMAISLLEEYAGATVTAVSLWKP